MIFNGIMCNKHESNIPQMRLITKLTGNSLLGVELGLGCVETFLFNGVDPGRYVHSCTESVLAGLNGLRGVEAGFVISNG